MFGLNQPATRRKSQSDSIPANAAPSPVDTQSLAEATRQFEPAVSPALRTEAGDDVVVSLPLDLERGDQTETWLPVTAARTSSRRKRSLFARLFPS
jgi:hypothetical protein